jgi:hypothetical protein
VSNSIAQRLRDGISIRAIAADVSTVLLAKQKIKPMHISVSKSKIHHLLNYVDRKKEIPRKKFNFFGLAQPSAKI